MCVSEIVNSKCDMLSTTCVSEVLRNIMGKTDPNVLYDMSKDKTGK